MNMKKTLPPLVAIWSMFAMCSAPSSAAVPGPVTAQISCGKPTRDGRLLVKFKLSCGPVIHTASVTGITANMTKEEKAAEVVRQINADFANQRCDGNKGIDAIPNAGSLNKVDIRVSDKTPIPPDKAEVTLQSLEVSDSTGQSGTFTPDRKTGAMDFLTMSGVPSGGNASATFNSQTVSVSTTGQTSEQVVHSLSNALLSAGVVNRIVSVSQLLDPGAINNTVAIEIPMVTDQDTIWATTTDPGIESVMQIDFAGSIPTLSEWGVIILGLLLLITGMRFVLRNAL